MSTAMNNHRFAPPTTIEKALHQSVLNTEALAGRLEALKKLILDFGYHENINRFCYRELMKAVGEPLDPVAAYEDGEAQTLGPLPVRDDNDRIAAQLDTEYPYDGPEAHE